jgi:hypothetical protein
LTSDVVQEDCCDGGHHVFKPLLGHQDACWQSASKHNRRLWCVWKMTTRIRSCSNILKARRDSMRLIVAEKPRVWHVRQRRYVIIHGPYSGGCTFVWSQLVLLHHMSDV